MQLGDSTFRRASSLSMGTTPLTAQSHLKGAPEFWPQVKMSLKCIPQCNKILGFCPKSGWNSHVMLKMRPLISRKFIWEECPVLPYVYIFHCDTFPGPDLFLTSQVVTLKTLFFSPSVFHKADFTNSYGYFLTCFPF